jgi:hypothetical protein
VLCIEHGHRRLSKRLDKRSQRVADVAMIGQHPLRELGRCRAGSVNQRDLGLCYLSQVGDLRLLQELLVLATQRR